MTSMDRNNVVLDTGWDRIARPASPHVATAPISSAMIEDYVRVVQFADRITNEQLTKFCTEMENTDPSSVDGRIVPGYPGSIGVRAELMFGTNSKPVQYRFTTTYFPIGLWPTLFLRATTPTGTTLLFDACLTGDIQEDRDPPHRNPQQVTTVNAIEILVAASCFVRGSRSADLTKVRRVWARPDDLCRHGTTLTHQKLIHEAAEIRIVLAQKHKCGVLGGNLP